ncbi:hypothetical protein [Desulfatitalea alkaliphila]|uniref:Uncharacterized protein n=1 Tax=Desulfatitalea alkaliphila TaxID=2929485 RepID=A0AA41R197_9BACT|nr:hypothetical protein [Desulfatitalea alkaliphila]MCJ8501032.1 hypothetical protein [Desulfatitalea alkaliphila]
MTKRRKPPMADRIKALLDPTDWGVIFQDLDNLATEAPDRIPSFTRFVIADPLEAFIKDELDRHGLTVCYGDAMALLIVVNATVKHIGDPDALRDAISDINWSWRDFYASASKQQIAAASDTQRKRASKPRTREGVAPKEREKRNQAIIDHYGRLRHRLTASAFAEKYAIKYCLKPRTIRAILSKRVGT